MVITMTHRHFIYFTRICTRSTRYSVKAPSLHLSTYKSYSSSPSLNPNLDTLAHKNDMKLSGYPYRLSDTTLQTIKFLTRAHLSNPKGSKNVILVSPHPGSGRMMSKIVEHVAKDMDAHVVELNYLEFLQVYQTMDKSEIVEPKECNFILYRDLFNSCYGIQ